MARPFYTYMLKCSDGSYYTGHTDDLPRRLVEHKEGIKCHYTFSRRPIRLVWNQEFGSREEARLAENRVKRWSRAKKEALIDGDSGIISKASRKTDWEGYQRRRVRRKSDEGD